MALSPPPSRDDRPTPDADAGWISRLPASLRPYARIARFDRPIGIWLLFWPCAWGLTLGAAALETTTSLAEINDGAVQNIRPWLAVCLALGAIVMRGAGCVYNDIVDRDLDRQVARTRNRPLASGHMSLRAAWIWLGILVGLGFLALLGLPGAARLWALGSLPLVAAYPFMKRLTWWPQAWLGLTFNWGLLVAAAALDALTLPTWLLYAGGVFWTLGYDSIYALQDMEDDALAGIKSSARWLSSRGGVRGGILVFYSLAALCLMGGVGLAYGAWAALWLVPAALHLGWQVARLTPDEQRALDLFRANKMTGALIFIGLAMARFFQDFAFSVTSFSLTH